MDPGGKNLGPAGYPDWRVVGRGFRAAATMDTEQYFEAGEGAKAV